jgi:hypothetical protein
MRRFSPCSLLILILILAAISPTEAAGKPGTWWGALDAWNSELVNVNMDVGLTEDPGLTSGGSVVAHDYSAEFTGKIRAGWRAKDPTENSYTISYWNFDEGDSLDHFGGILPAISDPLFGNFSSSSAHSEVNVKASVLDLMITRRLAGSRKATWYWGAGIRKASYEQDWMIQYFDSSLGLGGPRETVKIGLESDALGMTAGIGGVFTWNSWLRTSARAQAALLSGETDFSLVDRGFNDDILVLAFQTTGIERKGEDRLIQQLEMEVRVLFRVWRALDLSVGYTFINLGSMAQVEKFFDDFQGAPGGSRRDAAFHGLTIGAAFSFN